MQEGIDKACSGEGARRQGRVSVSSVVLVDRILEGSRVDTNVRVPNVNLSSYSELVGEFPQMFPYLCCVFDVAKNISE